MRAAAAAFVLMGFGLVGAEHAQRRGESPRPSWACRCSSATTSSLAKPSSVSRAFMRMVRTSEWKLVRHHYANGLDELYNLTDDPGELRNLYNVAMQRPVRDELQQRLTKWMQSVNDPLLQAPTLPPRIAVSGAAGTGEEDD